MSWTPVSDLTCISYAPGVVVDSTPYHNDGRMVGGLAGHHAYVRFTGADDQLVLAVKDDSLRRFTALRVEVVFRPAPGATHRLNLVEGLLSFAFYVEADRSLV